MSIHAENSKKIDLDNLNEVTVKGLKKSLIDSHTEGIMRAVREQNIRTARYADTSKRVVALIYAIDELTDQMADGIAKGRWHAIPAHEQQQLLESTRVLTASTLELGTTGLEMIARGVPDAAEVFEERLDILEQGLRLVKHFLKEMLGR